MLLPDLRPVAPVIERMRNVARTISIAVELNDRNERTDDGSNDSNANRATLCLSVHLDLMDMTTYFRGLSTELQGQGGSDGSSSSSSADAEAGAGRRKSRTTCVVAAKDLHRFVKAMATHCPSAEVLLCIIPGHSIVLHMVASDRSGTVTCILSLLDSGTADGDEGDEDGPQQQHEGEEEEAAWTDDSVAKQLHFSNVSSNSGRAPQAPQALQASVNSGNLNSGGGGEREEV